MADDELADVERVARRHVIDAIAVDAQVVTEANAALVLYRCAARALALSPPGPATEMLILGLAIYKTAARAT